MLLLYAMIVGQGGNQNFSQHYEDCCLPTGLGGKPREAGRNVLQVSGNTLRKSKRYPLGSKLSSTKFHLVPCRRESYREQSAMCSSSFIGEHSIIEALGWRARSPSSQAITVYNSKSDDHYQRFKDSPETAFL